MSEPKAAGGDTDFYDQEPRLSTLSDRDLLNLLSVAQKRGVDLLPITWESGLPTIGIGATADIRQSSVNVNLDLAFKRARLEQMNYESRHTLFRALTTETFVLGHPTLRNHRHISRLEGICWEFVGDEAWPVLVFKKSTHGNLKDFMLSKAGRDLPTAKRLQLCTDISSALMQMHACRIIHGDIKPENVLIFEDADSEYFAKVADFGYSTIVPYGSSNPIILPRSPPWNAPELCEQRMGLSFAQAKLADIFSFALLCFWTLFKDDPSLNNLLDEYGMGSLQIEASGPPWITHLKKSKSLQVFAARMTRTMAGLDEDEKEKLNFFWNWALSHDPDQRHITNSKIEQVREICQQWLLSKHDDIETVYDKLSSTVKIDGLEYLYLDMDKVFEGFEPNSTMLFTHDNVESALERVDFDLIEIFMQVILADYRLWSSIYNSLNALAKSRMGDVSIQEVAFPLALCARIGLGTRMSLLESSDWLSQSGKSDEEMQSALKSLQDLESAGFKTRQISIDNLRYGDVYRRAGILDEARKTYETTASDMEITLGTIALPVVRLRFIEALILHSQGLFDQQAALLESLKECYGKTFGPEHKHHLTAMAMLAGCYGELGRWEEAENLGLQLEQVPSGVFEAEVPFLTASKVNLAYVYWRQAKWKKAEDLLVRMLEFRTSINGPSHPSTLLVAINLASVFDYQGRLSDAENLKLKTLKQCSVSLGREHDYAIAIMGNLAGNYRLQKRYQEASKLEREVMNIRKKKFGVEHPHTLISMGNLASSYALMGLWQEAFDLDEYVMRTSIATLGYDNPDTVTSMNNLAHTYFGMERHDEAIELMTDVVKRREKLLGVDHPDTKKSTTNLNRWHSVK